MVRRILWFERRIRLTKNRELKTYNGSIIQRRIAIFQFSENVTNPANMKLTISVTRVMLFSLIRFCTWFTSLMRRDITAPLDISPWNRIERRNRWRYICVRTSNTSRRPAYAITSVLKKEISPDMIGTRAWATMIGRRTRQLPAVRTLSMSALMMSGGSKARTVRTTVNPRAPRMYGVYGRTYGTITLKRWSKGLGLSY
ncbi:MAG: hypothetical protein BWY06_00781 [Candidatus Latescibacteria bacterium ADurb.Bin168]|nr:MAG: hypothetical protein BWY06_00781 [Candidatus Latescibacteria bacterium ADurb.Bin168]